MSNMQFEKTSYAGDVLILKRRPFEGIAISLNFASVEAGSDGKKVVKAGTPISSSGVAANTGDAIGILLHDVAEERPVGTILTKAYIDEDIAEAHCGLTYDSTMKAALPMIVFE